MAKHYIFLHYIPNVFCKWHVILICKTIDKRFIVAVLEKKGHSGILMWELHEIESDPMKILLKKKKSLI